MVSFLLCMVVLVIYQTALINPQRYEKDSLTFVHGFFVYIIIRAIPKGTIGKLPQSSGETAGYSWITVADGGSENGSVFGKRITAVELRNNIPWEVQGLKPEEEECLNS